MVRCTKKNQTKSTKDLALKHIIEQWGGRYVSTSDVCVAAELHPNIHGAYPFFSISSRLTEPSIDRLKNISEAMTQSQYRDRYDSKIYYSSE